MRDKIFRKVATVGLVLAALASPSAALGRSYQASGPTRKDCVAKLMRDLLDRSHWLHLELIGEPKWHLAWLGMLPGSWYTIAAFSPATPRNLYSVRLFARWDRGSCWVVWRNNQDAVTLRSSRGAVLYAEGLRRNRSYYFEVPPLKAR